MPILFSTRRLPGLAACCLLACYACRQPPHAYQPPPPPEAVAAKPSMLFMGFKMSTNPDSTHRVELLNTSVVTGRVKSLPEARPTGTYLLVSQLDAGQQVLATLPQDHPLLRQVEYQNDQGALSRKTIRLPEAEFFVRLALHPQTATVRVEEAVQDNVVRSFTFPLAAKP